jgi:hypothetical protein
MAATGEQDWWRSWKAVEVRNHEVRLAAGADPLRRQSPSLAVAELKAVVSVIGRLGLGGIPGRKGFRGRRKARLSR